MTRNLGILAAALVVICHTHVTVVPGVTIALSALLVPLLLALCAAGAWVTVRLARGFRSSPAWRPAPAAAGAGGPGTGTPCSCPCQGCAGGHR